MSLPALKTTVDQTRPLAGAASGSGARKGLGLLGAALAGAAMFLATAFSPIAPSAAMAPAQEAVQLTPENFARLAVRPHEQVPEKVRAVSDGKILLDYEVAYLFPVAPVTVPEPADIRTAPSEELGEVVREARPGERLRVNGVVEIDPETVWFRIRLRDGRDGFVAGEVMDLREFRRVRAAERAAEEAARALEASLMMGEGLSGAPLSSVVTDLGPADPFGMFN